MRESGYQAGRHPGIHCSGCGQYPNIILVLIISLLTI